MAGWVSCGRWSGCGGVVVSGASVGGWSGCEWGECGWVSCGRWSGCGGVVVSGASEVGRVVSGVVSGWWRQV